MQRGDGNLGQAESFYQALQRGRVRSGTGATLQVRDAACAQPCLFRELLLGQASCQPMASQQLAECPWLACRGCSHSASPRVVVEWSRPTMVRTIVARASGREGGRDGW